MSARHTPGPWEAIPGGGVVRTKMEGFEGGYLIADLYARGLGPDAPTREQNARLIAAAPELLEAVVWHLEMTPSTHHHVACPSQNGFPCLCGRDAIVRATGGAS